MWLQSIGANCSARPSWSTLDFDCKIFISQESAYERKHRQCTSLVQSLPCCIRLVSMAKIRDSAIRSASARVCWSWLVRTLMDVVKVLIRSSASSGLESRVSMSVVVAVWMLSLLAANAGSRSACAWSFVLRSSATRLISVRAGPMSRGIGWT